MPCQNESRQRGAGLSNSLGGDSSGEQYVRIRPISSAVLGGLASSRRPSLCVASAAPTGVTQQCLLRSFRIDVYGPAGRPAKLIVMPAHDIDRAIDLLAAGTEDPTDVVHAVILGQAAGFAGACNEISVRTAQRLLNGSLSFRDADEVMNWVWSYVVGWLAAETERPLPEPMYSIYDAVDAGEYAHHGDAPGTDPVLTYTMPALESIVKSLPPPT